MSDIELIEADDLTGMRQYLVPSIHDDGTFQIVNEQNITPVLEQNYEIRKETDKHTRWGDGQIVARVPNVVVDELFRKGIIRDQKALRKWANAPENQVFRLRHGKV